jgi:AdoMet-dependent heme synthase
MTGCRSATERDFILSPRGEEIYGIYFLSNTRNMPKKTGILKPDLRMIAWEITRSCNLNCLHCRAAAERGPYKDELTTEECFQFINEVAAFSKPVLILTGGEPLLREDVFEIASYGTRQGLRVVMAINGTLFSAEKARAAKQAGIQRVSISLDGASAASHDQFRGVIGAFAGAMEGIRYLKEAGLAFQINTTVTKRNLGEIEDILQLAIEAGAAAHHIFLLVPTGRGRELAHEGVTPEEYEQTLTWFAGQDGKAPIQLKATCAPQYYRIIHQQGKTKERKGEGDGLHTFTRGCLGGISFCFVSHRGDIQPCGYLEVITGNIKERPFQEIWEKAEVFQRLRDVNNLTGRCGRCAYRLMCGGCRARAYASKGDYLAEEPLCPYQPQ